MFDWYIAIHIWMFPVQLVSGAKPINKEMPSVCLSAGEGGTKGIFLQKVILPTLCTQTTRFCIKTGIRLQS